MDEKLDFFTSYGTIDIWQSQNTMSGITKYVLYYNNKQYQRETPAEIIALAKYLVEKDALER